MGIRDFIRYLEEHREKAQRAGELSPAERDETLKQAQMMIGMAQGASRSIDSVIRHRQVNLSEEHALRFAQDLFLHLADDEKRIRDLLEGAA